MANISENEGIEIVCRAYENVYKDNLPIPTHYLREMLRLILKENFFQFKGKHHRQTAMDKKTAVSFANIFMAYIKTQILSTQNRQSLNHQFGIDPWDVRKSDIAAFFAQANFKETYITLIFNSRPKYLTLRLCF